MSVNTDMISITLVYEHKEWNSPFQHLDMQYFGYLRIYLFLLKDEMNIG